GDQTMTVFIVYVHGAAEPQTASVGHGSSQTLTFTGVADLGNVAQPVVAMNGPFRWFSPGVDIKAGATAQTALNITGAGMRDLGAYAPLWSADGKQIGFWAGRLWRSSTKAPAGSSALQPLMKGENPPTVSAWDWGPTPALANQILYAPALAESMITGDYGIYQLTIGEQGRGLKLAEYSNSQSGETVSLAGLAWLPDGSGFLYAKESLRSALESDASGTMSVKKHAGTAVYRYQFSTKKSMLIKYLEGNAIQSLSISPDGQWIVFETGKSLEEKSNELLSGKKAVVPDLWVMRLDGSQPRLLVKNGSGPAWGVMGK
ncbi:MAG TPA: hypothetical protein VD996_05595, partial [Chitinophagaceae bacterium]|nr:hypothetical protein [Chitinophagaceae bacterium]